MKIYGNFFVSLRVVISELRLTEKERKKEERRKKKKKDKTDIFASGLLDYTKRWKNVEGRFTIGKRSLIV